MVELNPHNPVTEGLRGQWHKLVALVLWKHRDVLPKDIVLTARDFDQIEAEFADRGGAAVLAHEKPDGLHLRVVDMEEARRLERETRATN